MRLACSTLIHTSLSLEETLLRVKAIGFNYVEIDFFKWGHLDLEHVVRDIKGTVERIQAGCEAADLTPIALSLGLHGTLEMQLRQLEAAARAALSLNIGYLTFQAAPKEDLLEVDLERASRLVQLAQAHGVALGIETHFFVHTENPSVALRYVQEVPGLNLTLDPSHYVAGPYWERGFDDLLRYVRFIHIRSAGRGGWDKIQQPAGTGVIDYAELFGVLQAIGFSGDASVEYVEGAPGVQNPSYEAKRMKELIERL